MKLSDYARRMGVRYETAGRWFRDGKTKAVEVVNQAENGTEGLLADLTAIISSFCARLYGRRHARRKTEAIVRELEAKGDGDATR